MMFAKKYNKFDEWLAAHPQATAYQRRIVRLHTLHPDASLSQLRGHATQDEQTTTGSMPARKVPKTMEVPV